MSAKQDFVLPINGSEYRFRRSFEVTKGKLMYSVSDTNDLSQGMFLFEQEINGRWTYNGIENDILRTEVLRRIVINEIS